MLIKKNLHYSIAETTMIWLIPYTDNLTLAMIMKAITVFCRLSNLKHSHSPHFLSETKMALRVCCNFNREKDGKDMLQTIDGVLEERNNHESYVGSE